MAITITDSQAFTASVSAVDAKGNPALIDGAPIWTSSNPLIITVVPSANPLTARVSAVGPLGAAQVVVTADADLGAGVRTLTGILDVTILGGAAVSLSIAASTPQEQ
jgi:hypothetical protein